MIWNETVWIAKEFIKGFDLDAVKKKALLSNLRVKQALEKKKKNFPHLRVCKSEINFFALKWLFTKLNIAMFDSSVKVTRH